MKTAEITSILLLYCLPILNVRFVFFFLLKSHLMSHQYKLEARKNSNERKDNQGLFKCCLLVLTDTIHTVRNRFNAVLNALITGRVKRPNMSLHLWPFMKKVSASSALRLQTHFLRQSTVLNFEMRSPSADPQFLSKQALCLCTNNILPNSIYHNSLSWKKNASTVAATRRWIPS